MSSGFQRRLVVPGEQSEVRHAALSPDDDVIVVASASQARARISTRGLGRLH